MTALHTVNNPVAKRYNQIAPPARSITVALDMSKVFDTVNIHTLIGKLLQTNIPDTIIKFIANNIKGRKTYTTYSYHTSSQRQFKICILLEKIFLYSYKTTNNLQNCFLNNLYIVYIKDVDIYVYKICKVTSSILVCINCLA